jgi:hypothetical protein
MMRVEVEMASAVLVAVTMAVNWKISETVRVIKLVLVLVKLSYSTIVQVSVTVKRSTLTQPRLEVMSLVVRTV